MRVCEALFIAGLLTALLGACSRGELPDIPLEPTRAVDDTEGLQNAYGKARAICTQEARRKGISSVTRILLFRGKTSEADYVACMERKGFVRPEESGQAAPKAL